MRLRPLIVPIAVSVSEVCVPMTVSVGETVLPMAVSTTIVTGEGPIYHGSYDVTPLAGTEVILETQGRRMTDDVTVREIPYFETTNEAGGYTVIIG